VTNVAGSVFGPADTLRAIGRTTLRTPPLGLGTVALGNYPHAISDTTAFSTVERAWQAGIRLFDTAPLYGRGLAERRVGLALAGHPRDSFLLATKIGRRLVPSRSGSLNADPGASIFVDPPPFDTVFDYSHDGALRSIDDSLQRLGLGRIDIVHVHNIDPSLHDASTLESMFSACMSGAYRAISRLRDEGVIGAIGVGNNSLQMLERFMREGDFDCLMMAGHYTLLEQDAALWLLPECLRRSVSILLGSPFESGILASGVRADARFRYRTLEPDVAARVQRLEAVCRRHRVPLASAAIAFPLAHPTIAAVVPGMAGAEQVDASANALRQRFPDGFWTELREAARWDAALPLPA
jgi:D-threo-aldose 1-dehydrogenase